MEGTERHLTTMLGLRAWLLLLALTCTMWACPAFAAGVSVQSASDEQRDAAARAYEEAKVQFEASRFGEALEGFRASYAIVASPNAHYMMVACLSELGRSAEAYDESTVALAEAREAAASDPERYGQTLTTLETTEQELRGKIGIVRLELPPGLAAGARLTVDGAEIDRGRWDQPLAVAPGSHTLTLSGYDDETIDIAAGGDASVAFSRSKPVPAPEPTAAEPEEGWFVENRRTFAYAAGGVGAAGMILFAVFGGLALSTEGDLDETCNADKRCPTETAEDIDDGKTYQVVANTGLVVGIVGLSAGAALLTWDLLDDEDDAERARLRVGPGSVALEGSF
jgi:hypothetical protein